MSNSRVGGVLQCSVDGVWVDATECSYVITETVQEPIVALNKTVWYTETPAVGEIKLTIVNTGKTRLKELTSKRAAKVIVELANGKTVIGNGMVHRGTNEPNGKDGTVVVEFFGADVTELGA